MFRRRNVALDEAMVFNLLLMREKEERLVIIIFPERDGGEEPQSRFSA